MPHELFKKHWRRAQAFVGSTDYSLIGINAVNQRYQMFHDGGEEVQDSHFVLRKKLVKHYNRQYVARQIEWLT